LKDKKEKVLHANVNDKETMLYNQGAMDPKIRANGRMEFNDVKETSR
jgi:hypothetical protein